MKLDESVVNEILKYISKLNYDFDMAACKHYIRKYLEDLDLVHKNGDPSHSILVENK